jgi:A/G-specific adenine glycosylase
MLQQTQVERVIPYFEEWLRLFPNTRSLAKAPLSNVLRAWQGLGYNRRAKNLQLAAKAIVTEHKGVFPKSVEALEALPGIGPYTARAVAAFAFNQDVVFIETNIRTVVTHHFFPGTTKVDDKQILEILTQTLPKGRAREWYSALMDYGSYLKRSGVRINARAKNYTKQAKFAGSAREARGAVLKALAKGPRASGFLTEILGPSRRMQVKAQLASLTKEGMIELKGGKFRLPR